MYKHGWFLNFGSNIWKFIMESPKWSGYDNDCGWLSIKWSAISDSALLLLLLLSFFYSSRACLPYKTTSEKFLWWLLIITMNTIRAQKRGIRAPQDPP